MYHVIVIYAITFPSDLPEPGIEFLLVIFLTGSHKQGLAMRVLFVNEWIESLGIEALSAYLKMHGHEVDLVSDPNPAGSFFFTASILNRFLNFRQCLIDKIRSFQPHLIAFSFVTNSYPWAKKMALVAKETSDAPIIAGGIHPTIMPEDVLGNDCFDYVCRGEGEEALLELVKQLESEGDVTWIKNIWGNSNGAFFKNPVRPFIEDLDSLPFPDKEIFWREGVFTKRAYVISSRGCPFDCSYCYNSYLHRLYRHKGPHVRRRSVGNVIEELKLYKQKFRIDSVHFQDDTFTAGAQWLRVFTERYPAEVGLPFYCLVRPNTITREVVSLLQKAGCHTVRMGIESGDAHIRNAILRRNMDDDMILNAARLIKEAGIRLELVVMFGLPHETPEKAWKTVEIMFKVNADGFFTNMLTLFPGTDIAEYSIKNGLIDAETLRKISQGELGRMQGESILNQPSRYFLTNIKVLAPFLRKLPFLKGLVRRVSHTRHVRLVRLIYVFSIPFMSFWESMARMRETLHALAHYTLRRYRSAIRRQLHKLSLE